MDKDGFIVQGYALDGRGEAITSVQVCLVLDNECSTPLEKLVEDSLQSDSWIEADLRREKKEKDHKIWSWTLFSAHLPVANDLQGKSLAILCRAMTAEGREQETLTDW